MTIDVESIPGPDWRALAHKESHGVYCRVLLSNEQTHVVMLRFELHATIQEHAAGHDIDVICVEGEGFISIGEEWARFRQGQSVRWPQGVPHRLWTKAHGMVTLMVEHFNADS